MGVKTINRPKHRGKYKTYKGVYKDVVCGGGEKTLRRCLGLGCEEMFESSGKGNRICPKCSNPKKRRTSAQKS